MATTENDQPTHWHFPLPIPVSSTIVLPPSIIPSSAVIPIFIPIPTVAPFIAASVIVLPLPIVVPLRGVVLVVLAVVVALVGGIAAPPGGPLPVAPPLHEGGWPVGKVLVFKRGRRSTFEVLRRGAVEGSLLRRARVVLGPGGALIGLLVGPSELGTRIWWPDVSGRGRDLRPQGHGGLGAEGRLEGGGLGVGGGGGRWWGGARWGRCIGMA